MGLAGATSAGISRRNSVAVSPEATLSASTASGMRSSPPTSVRAISASSTFGGAGST